MVLGLTGGFLGLFLLVGLALSQSTTWETRIQESTSKYHQGAPLDQENNKNSWGLFNSLMNLFRNFIPLIRTLKI